MKKLLARSLVVWVSVLEMTRQEYNDLRGWDLPENENGDDTGYLVEDPEGQKNTPQYDGYVQWLPKAEFERKFAIECNESGMSQEKAVTEQELAEKAVAPRVTKSDIDALKERIQYTTEQCPGGTTSTFVHAFLDGKFFLATGFSACVNAENFDAGIGERLARSNAEKHAENKLWELEGYRLFTKPSQPKSHIERMQVEKHELDVKLTALNTFLAKFGTDQAPLIDDNQAYLLEEQAKYMTFYSNILGERISYDSGLLQAIG